MNSKVDKAVSADVDINFDIDFICPDHYSEYEKQTFILDKLIQYKLDSISNCELNSKRIVANAKCEQKTKKKHKSDFNLRLEQRQKQQRQQMREKSYQDKQLARHQRHSKSRKSANKDQQNDAMSKRAKWVIIATSFLLIFLCLFLVGITLRIAPLIDELVRKENEELVNSLNRNKG